MAPSTKRSSPAQSSGQTVITNPLRPSSYAGSAIVTIYVGPKRKKYVVHEDLICAYSSYFRSCFREGAFAEGDTKESYLTGKHETPAAMDLIFDGLYGVALVDKITPLGIPVLDAYVTADKLGMEALCNVLVDSVQTVCAHSVNLDIPLTYLPLAGLGQSRMQQYLNHRTAYIMMLHQNSGNPEARKDELDSILPSVSAHPGLAHNMFEALMLYHPFNLYHRGEAKDPRVKQGCRFHDHSQGSTCTGSPKSNNDQKQESTGSKESCTVPKQNSPVFRF